MFDQHCRQDRQKGIRHDIESTHEVAILCLDLGRPTIISIVQLKHDVPEDVQMSTALRVEDHDADDVDDEL